jgi:hypothetical protein
VVVAMVELATMVAVAMVAAVVVVAVVRVGHGGSCGGSGQPLPLDREGIHVICSSKARIHLSSSPVSSPWIPTASAQPQPLLIRQPDLPSPVSQ